MYLLRAISRSLATTLFLVGIVLSPNAYLAIRALALAGHGALLDYKLKTIPPAEYDAAIGAALDRGDGDQARSLMALAKDQNIVLPPELDQGLAALPAVDLGNVLRQGWSCVVNGDFDSEAGFACVVATDVTGVGDVRDLVGEGSNYVQGKPVNYFTVGVATVGLTLTAATVATLGGALPVRAGASFLKAMSKLGRLPPKLGSEVGLALARTVDTVALGEAVNLGRELRFGEMQAPLARLFKPKSLDMVKDLATDFGTIGSVGGVRAMKLSAEVADDAKDVKALAKMSTIYKERFLGVMTMLGHGALRLADILLVVSSWALGALLWLIGFAMFLTRVTGRTARFVARALRPKLRRRVRQAEAAVA